MPGPNASEHILGLLISLRRVILRGRQRWAILFAAIEAAEPRPKAEALLEILERVLLLRLGLRLIADRSGSSFVGAKVRERDLTVLRVRFA